MTRKTRRMTWRRRYRARIEAGLERCRWCDSDERLTFDHIVPIARGGGNGMDNATILCQPCNLRKSAELGWHTDMRSLADEEASAPASRRWSQLPAAALANDAA